MTNCIFLSCDSPMKTKDISMVVCLTPYEKRIRRETVKIERTIDFSY